MKLMVLDGNSILNRAYYGIRPLSTRQGLYTHAIYGFLTTLQRLLDETDVLVDGPFILAQRSLELDFCGSKNQRLIDMNATRREGRIVLWTPPEW